MAVEWFEVTSTTQPQRGWIRAIGRVQSEWEPGEHFFDSWVPIGVDLSLGISFLEDPNTRTSTFLIIARVIVDSRSVPGKSAIRYEGLSEKFKYGEACIEENGVRGSITYLNFSRQYLCVTQFFCPNVTRAAYTDTLPIVPLQAEWITFGNTHFSNQTLSNSEYSVLSGVRMRGYDDVETRATVYYRAFRVAAYKITGAPLPVSVFSV